MVSAALAGSAKLHERHILNAFQRFGYEIKAAFNEEEYLESLQDRYQALMNYLNV